VAVALLLASVTVKVVVLQRSTQIQSTRGRLQETTAALRRGSPVCCHSSVSPIPAAQRRLVDAGRRIACKIARMPLRYTRS
jgi:hypothetical protein